MTRTDSRPPNLLLLSDLVQKDRIQILLSEYTALRSEVLSRTGYGFQIMGISSVVLTWAATQSSSSISKFFWPVMILIGIGFVISIFVNTRDLTKAANRIKDIEHEINSRAGEHLLIYETLSGALTRMGLFKSFFSRIEPLPGHELPPLDPSYLAKAIKPHADARHVDQPDRPS